MVNIEKIAFLGFLLLGILLLIQGVVTFFGIMTFSGFLPTVSEKAALVGIEIPDFSMVITGGYIIAILAIIAGVVNFISGVLLLLRKE